MAGDTRCGPAIEPLQGAEPGHAALDRRGGNRLSINEFRGTWLKNNLVVVNADDFRGGPFGAGFYPAPDMFGKGTGWDGGDFSWRGEERRRHVEQSEILG